MRYIGTQGQLAQAKQTLATERDKLKNAPSKEQRQTAQDRANRAEEMFRQARGQCHRVGC
jgi:hypothetical protein